MKLLVFGSIVLALGVLLFLFCKLVRKRRLRTLGSLENRIYVDELKARQQELKIYNVNFDGSPELWALSSLERAELDKKTCVFANGYIVLNRNGSVAREEEVRMLGFYVEPIGVLF